MTVLERIAKALSMDALVSEIAKRAAELDEYTALKMDVADPALRQERAVLHALRQEYRVRTGEVL